MTMKSNATLQNSNSTGPKSIAAATTRIPMNVNDEPILDFPAADSTTGSLNIPHLPDYGWRPVTWTSYATRASYRWSDAATSPSTNCGFAAAAGKSSVPSAMLPRRPP